MSIRPYPRTALTTLLTIICCWGIAPEAQARVSRAASRARCTRAQLQPHLGKRACLQLVRGDPLLVRIRRVGPRHLRVQRPDGSFANVALSTIRKIHSPGRRLGRWHCELKILRKPATLPFEDDKIPGLWARNLGIALTFGGLGGAVIPMVLDLAKNDVSSNVTQGLAIGFASLFAAGVVTWVTASVYRKTHLNHPEAEPNRKFYKRMGMVFTLGGLGITALGVGLGFGIASTGSLVGLAIGVIIGSAVGGTGAFATLFVGLPMWITAASAAGASGKTPSQPPSKPWQVSPLSDRSDPHLDPSALRFNRRFLPRAQMFTLSSAF